jgi:hypothetical protein
MKKKKSLSLLFCLFIFMLICFAACNEYNEPGAIFVPDKPYPASPVIQSVTPANSAVAGVREITIAGSNFSTVADSNWVIIGGQRALIKSASANSLVIYRPPTFGTGLSLKVEVPSTLSAAVVNNYTIEEPISQFGDFTLTPRAFFCMDLDKQGNMWMASRQYFYKLSADAYTLTTYMTNTTFLKDKKFVEFYDVKVGPDGFVYTTVKNKPEIYRIDPVTAADPEIYVTLPSNTAKMDFNSNGDIYSGQANGIFLVKPDKSVSAVGDYGTSTSFVEIRVINGFVYAMDSTTMYKSAIDSGGTLGNKQVVYNIASSSNISSCTMSSFAMAEDGTIYLCVKKHPQYSIFVLESDGSATPYYFDNILPINVDQIIWGSTKTMFLSRGRSAVTADPRLYRMGMDKNGVPNLGRQ